MPYRFTVDEINKTVFFQASGELTPSEFLTCLSEVVSDPSFEPGFNHLVDLTCCTRLAVSALHMRQRTDADKKLAHSLGFGKCALVTNNFFSYAVTRIYKTLMRNGPLQIGLFRELLPAYRWLEIAPTSNLYTQITEKIWINGLK